MKVKICICEEDLKALSCEKKQADMLQYWVSKRAFTESAKCQEALGAKRIMTFYVILVLAKNCISWTDGRSIHFSTRWLLQKIEELQFLQKKVWKLLTWS